MAPPRRTSSPRDIDPRAPRREGERTTLRVPDDLVESVARYADEHRTSTNDALIRLAYEGAARYEEEREIAELARVRSAAIMRLTDVPAGTEMLSGEETAKAILGFRLGLYDEDEFGA